MSNNRLATNGALASIASALNSRINGIASENQAILDTLEEIQETLRQITNPGTCPETPPPEFRTAHKILDSVTMGINLGNSLDAWSSNPPSPWTPERQETWWDNPLLNEEFIDGILDQGFDSIRVPVTWHMFTTVNDSLPLSDLSRVTIAPQFMARVKQVVDWCYDRGVVVIINTHHDEQFFRFTPERFETDIHNMRSLIHRIATEFRNYDDRLIIQILNEPRSPGTPQEWIGTPEERQMLNTLSNAMVSAVRNSGGRNNERTLMVPTFAGQTHPDILSDFELPIQHETFSDRLIVTVQRYLPHAFALSMPGQGDVSEWFEERLTDTFDINDTLTRLNARFISQGVPVAMTEMGAMNRDNTLFRANWANFFAFRATQHNIKCWWWDNGSTDVSLPVQNDIWHDYFGLFDRLTGETPFEVIIDGLFAGIRGERIVHEVEGTPQPESGNLMLNPNGEEGGLHWVNPLDPIETSHPNFTSAWNLAHEGEWHETYQRFELQPGTRVRLEFYLIQTAIGWREVHLQTSSEEVVMADHWEPTANRDWEHFTGEITVGSEGWLNVWLGVGHAIEGQITGMRLTVV
jgi:endoglucanase